MSIPNRRFAARPHSPTRRTDLFTGRRSRRDGSLTGMAENPRSVDKTSSSLLRRIRDPQDHASWGEFVALYEPLLMRYVRKKGLNEHDAVDVVQGIFVTL